MSGATWLGGPMCLCWYGWFGMSICAPWDCSGLGSRLTTCPVVACLLAELQPMLTLVIRPPRACPGTPEGCRSAVVLGCCTPATLFIPKEFPCVFGTRNLGLFWFGPIRFWLLSWGNWPMQELGWQFAPIPNLRSDGEGLISEPDALGMRQDIDGRSFSGPLVEDWAEFCPEETQRQCDYNKHHYVSAFKVFLSYQKCTCENVSLGNSHHTSWLLIVRRGSGEMTTELIVWIVFALKCKGHLLLWHSPTHKFE